MKSWAGAFVIGLLVTTAISQTPVFAAESAEQILINKANYWRLKDRPDLAIEALQQLLSINPSQPEALYQYGVIEVQRGRIDDAKGYLTRLQRAAPGGARVTDLENAIRAGQVSPNELSEARRLAQTGQFSQAVEKYQQTFRGPPPPTFGVEYYTTMAGTPQRWQEAKSGLEALVEKSPNDSKAKLALAEVLSYRAETRVRGVRMLQQLTDDAVVGAQATRAWKQAMMWLGATAEDRQLYNQFLAKYPQDAEVQAHIAEAAKGGGPSGPGPGYVELNRGNLAAAERQFTSELRANPNDPNALTGLGIVRLRQRRLADARELLARAIREFRRELAANPDNRTAQTGLRGALGAEHAVQNAGRPGPGPTAAPVNTARTRADALRAEGRTLESRGDPAGAAAKFQEAIAVDPNNAWARLDFARFLVRQGDAAQAFQIIDPAASGGTAESLYAAAIFYDEQNRPGEAFALIERIPAGSRNAEASAFRERLLVTAEIDRAKQLARSGNRLAARNALMSLAQRAPQSAEKTRLVADALADIGDLQTALQLSRPNPAAARGDARGVVDYSRLLVRAGRDAEAVAYLTQAENSGRVGAEGRRELERVKIDLAVKRADALRTRGDIAGAYDQISPLMSAYPNDANLLLAAGRLYSSAGQNDIAMRFVDAAYRQAPGELGVIRGAIGGAIVAGDLDRARAYLSVGMQQFPNNPRLYYMAAEIARASGDNGTAIYNLDVARRLDTRQAGAYEPLPPGVSTAPPPAGGSAPLPANPFRRPQADLPQGGMTVAAAAPMVSAIDATSAPLPAAAAPPAPPVAGARPAGPPPMVLAAAAPMVSATDTSSAPVLAASAPVRVAAVMTTPAPLDSTAESADSDDLVLPPRAGERPPRRLAASARAAAPSATGYTQMAALPEGGGYTQTQMAQLPPLPPPPVYGYQTPLYPQQAAYAPAAPMQPLAPPPVYGYQPPYGAQPTPVPQDSLELDIERSMAAISAEAGPAFQGGFSFRFRSGEDGLSRLSDIGAPIEAMFSPFYTGTVRLQAVPTHLTTGKPDANALLRFGQVPSLGLVPGISFANVPQPGSQTANGISLNVAYAYQMFSGEIGTTPLGFPVENLVGRLALTWPGPAGNSTAYPRIPLAPTTVSQPLQVKLEAARQPITESMLSYAGTRDPVSGLVWGGVVKTGGTVLVSYDDGDVGLYGGGGFWNIEGKSVKSNSEGEGIIGAYIRPYRAGDTSFKVGLNLSYMGYDKNLRFFTFGQGGYFSPQNYINLSIPVEYSGRNGRFTYLVGGALGVQSFKEERSAYFPRDPGKQAALQGAFGNAAFYPERDVTGVAFNARGQLEYQLDNGFSVGGMAGIDNAQNYTEGVARLYLRKNFGGAPSAVFTPKPLPRSL